MNNSLSPLYCEANPSRAHSEANGVKAKADDAFGVIFSLWRDDVGGIREEAQILPPALKELTGFQFLQVFPSPKELS
jgi:hypothetical protein